MLYESDISINIGTGPEVWAWVFVGTAKKYLSMDLCTGTDKMVSTGSSKSYLNWPHYLKMYHNNGVEKQNSSFQKKDPEQV